MLQLIQNANLALRLALEVAALASLAYWGYHLVTTAWRRTALAVAAPLAAAVAWALLASPHANIALPGWAKAAVQVLILGLAAAALLQVRRQRLAAGFSALVVLNAALMAVWQQ